MEYFDALEVMSCPSIGLPEGDESFVARPIAGLLILRRNTCDDKHAENLYCLENRR
jgi:hypothetical protein